ncbi:MAG: hypothetical protein H8E14_09800 [Candidatus Marinimicrobia bacterium]|nr:hypothetical protein [Candidatus Neomarinimicrobiota bacterium]
MEEQLKVIQDMLEKTRRSVADNGIFLILWGWLVMVASMGQYVFVYFNRPEWIWLNWLVLMVGGGIVSAILGLRADKIAGVKTFASQAISALWIACGLAIFLIAFVALPLGVITMPALNPMIMIILWIGIFVMARIIEWKPLQWSGLVWFAAAIISMNIPWYYHGWVMAITLIPGYLIPGYSMRRIYMTEKRGKIR